MAESLSRNERGRARLVIRHVWRFGLVTAGVPLIVVSAAGSWAAFTIFDAAGLSDVLVVVAGLVLLRALGQLRVETFRGFKDIPLASLFAVANANVMAVAALGLMFLLAPGATTLSNVLGIVAAAAWNPGLVFSYRLVRRWVRC